MTSVFSEIEKVQAIDERANQYFLPGKYRVHVDNVLVHEKRFGGKLFIVETTIMGSDNADIKVGEQRNWVQPFENDSAVPRIKTFIGALMGYCPRKEMALINEKITQTVCENVALKNQLPANRILDLDCFNKRSMKTGKDFTIHLWQAVKAPGESMQSN